MKTKARSHRTQRLAAFWRRVTQKIRRKQSECKETPSNTGQEPESSRPEPRGEPIPEALENLKQQDDQASEAKLTTLEPELEAQFPSEPSPFPIPKLPSPSIHSIQGDLPLEVLNHIFLIYTTGLRDSHNDYSNEAIPWSLTHICHSWRQVAIHSPTFWNYFTLEVTDYNYKDGFPEMLQTLLSRAGTAPLRIMIDLSQYHELLGGVPFPNIQPLLDRSEQWVQVSIRGVDVPELYRQFNRIRTHIPNLQILKIYFRNRILRENITLPGESTMRHFELFKDAPKMTSVLLNDISDRLLSYEIILPWSQLEFYGAYNLSEATFPHALTRQPNLKTLHTIFTEHPRLPFPPIQIKHTNLRQLLLNISEEPEQCFEQLAYLELPSLESLVVVFGTMELRRKVSAVQAIISLLKKSDEPPPLKELVVSQNCDLHIQRLPELFRLVPGLETLDIGQGTYFRDVIKALTVKGDVDDDDGAGNEGGEKTLLLPNLRRLGVVYTLSTKPIDIKLIKDLIESRKRISPDGNSASQLLSPLLYVRIHIKRSETRYYCLHDLEGTYTIPEGQDPDSYPLKHESIPDFALVITKAMDELSPLLNSPTRTSESENAIILSKYREIESLYRAHVLYSPTRSLRPRGYDGPIVRQLRSLCNKYIPKEYIEKRTWIMADDENLFYLHPGHEARCTTQQADIVIGTKFPPASPLEGYGYWFHADIDRQLEHSRSYIC